MKLWSKKMEALPAAAQRCMSCETSAVIASAGPVRSWGCPRSTSQYRFKRTDDPRLLELTRQLVEENRRSGYRKLHFILQRDHAIVVNHKRF